jgi:sortase A
MTEWYPRRHQRRHAKIQAAFLARLGHTLIALGTLTMLFGGYQLWFTDTLQHSTQTQLTTEVRKYLPSGSSPRVSGTATPLPRSADPGEGHWVGLISIPAINLQQVVVNGTTVNDLRLGPGHYIGTPMPGEAGNVAIAGHRTTWGHPFRNLDKLKKGDQIVVSTPRADVLYRVAWSKVVAPTDLSVIGPSGGNTLTLTTCHPAYSASQRLVIRANLAAVGQLRHEDPSVTISKTIKKDVPRHSWWTLTLWAAITLALYLATLRILKSVRRKAVVIVVALIVAVPVVLTLFNAISWQLPAGY